MKSFKIICLATAAIAAVLSGKTLLAAESVGSSHTAAADDAFYAGPAGSESFSAAADSATFAALDKKMAEYFSSIAGEPIPSQCEEADFVIGTCTDSLLRNHVAVQAYNYFRDSRIMGAENVAIHIYDNWFASGKASMGNDFDDFEAKFFAQTNRSSLIGKKAPEVALRDSSGRSVKIPITKELTKEAVGTKELTKEAAGTNKYKILFFYDTECPKCLIESILLRNMLENDGFSAQLYAIYVGKDEAAWKDFACKNLDFRSENLDVVHLWNPADEGDLAMTYGIVQTPRMFLLSPAGIILGRGLDSYSVEKLLALVFDESLEYGSDEGIALCKELLSTFGESDKSNPGESDRSNPSVEIAGHLCERMENDILRRPALKTLLADMMYCISSSRDENLLNGAGEFLDKFILSRDDLWTTKTDSLQVVGLASFMKEMLGRTPIGSRLPQIEVNATVKTLKGKRIREKSRVVNLGKLRGKTTRIMFYVEGCKLCEASIEAVDSLLINANGEKPNGEKLNGEKPNGESTTGERIKNEHVKRKTTRPLGRIVLIDVDEVFAVSPETSELLMDEFDLSALPFILETDSKGIVVRKYIQ